MPLAPSAQSVVSVPAQLALPTAAPDCQPSHKSVTKHNCHLAARDRSSPPTAPAITATSHTTASPARLVQRLIALSSLQTPALQRLGIEWVKDEIVKRLEDALIQLLLRRAINCGGTWREQLNDHIRVAPLLFPSHPPLPFTRAINIENDKEIRSPKSRFIA
jgi:hypothetical protein